MTRNSDFRIQNEDGEFRAYEITKSFRRPIATGTEQECQDHIRRLMNHRQAIRPAAKRTTKADIKNRIAAAGPEWSLMESPTVADDISYHRQGRQWHLCWKGRQIAHLGFTPSGSRPDWTSIYAAAIHELQKN